MILGLSPLRLTGIVVGLLLLLLASLRLRRYRGSRGATVLAGLAGASLLAVALFPWLVNLPAELFSLRGQRAGRLITLLILSSVLLWVLLVWDRAKLADTRAKYDQLIRALALRSFYEGDQPATAARRAPIWIVMPAFNEADNLVELLPAMPAQVAGRTVQTLVVDDSSSDDTAEVAGQHGVLVARMTVNAGGGTGLRTGFDIALQYGADVVVTMDADGQHDPEQIERLVEPILANRADLVLGSRLLGEHDGESIARAAGVRVFNSLINTLLGTRITDCASGFRAVRGDSLARLLLVQEQYHTAEMIIDAAKRGLSLTEVPITIRRRHSGTSKKGRNLFYGTFFLRTVLKTWLR